MKLIGFLLTHITPSKYAYSYCVSVCVLCGMRNILVVKML